MKLLHLAALVAWFTFALAGVANAGVVAAAIGWLATSTLGKLVLGVALQLGKSLLDRARQKKQVEPGITGQIQVGGNNSFSFIVGTYATAGQLEYPGTYGRVGKTPNAGLIQVFTLSDLPVTAIGNRAWINGEECNRNPAATINPATHAWLGAGSYPFTEYYSGGYYFLFAKYLLGHQTTADPALLSRLGTGARPWMNDMVGRGLAQVILSAEVKRELFKGFPAGRWQVDGVALYDPRKDSTVGGSGAHRWDPATAGTPASTYEFSNNPAVIIYNILRGIYHQGEWIYGPEVPALALPMANWFAAMNECDRPIARAGGGTEPQFRCGYEIKVEEMEPADVIEELLTSCNGRIAELGGTFKIHVGAPGLPVYFFTDDDIEVLNSSQNFDPFPGYQSVFNGVTSTYPEPSAGWEMKDAPRYVNTAHVSADGEERLASVTYNAVPFAGQVQRLIRATAEDNRRFRRHQLTLPPEAFLLEPLDVVAWSSARNGYEVKHFPINAMDDLDNVNQNVALQEADPSDYDWSTSFELPWSVGSLTPNRPPAQLLTGWQVAPAIIYDEQGRARRPSIEVFFDGDLEDVREVRIVTRVAGATKPNFDGFLPYGDPLENQNPRSVILNGNFPPNTPHVVQGILIPTSGRTAVWSAPLEVVTPDVRLSELDVIFSDDLRAEIEESYQRAVAFTGELAREAREAARRLAMYGLEQDGANLLDKQDLRTVITATAQGMEARYENVVTLIVAQDQIIAQRFEEVAVQLGEKASVSAVNLLSSAIMMQGETITAIGDAQIAIDAKVGNFYAGGLLRIRQVATESGAVSTAALSVAASEGAATPSQAAIILNAKAGGISEIGLISNRTYIRQGDELTQLATFSGGVFRLGGGIRANWAQIDNVQLTNAQIANAAITSTKRHGLLVQ
jgi:hypothetical protein